MYHSEATDPRNCCILVAAYQIHDRNQASTGEVVLAVNQQLGVCRPLIFCPVHVDHKHVGQQERLQREPSPETPAC